MDQINEEYLDKKRKPRIGFLSNIVLRLLMDKSESQKKGEKKTFTVRAYYNCLVFVMLQR